MHRQRDRLEACEAVRWPVHHKPRAASSTASADAFTIDTSLGLIEGFEATSREDAEVFVSRWLAQIGEWERQATAPNT